MLGEGTPAPGNEQFAVIFVWDLQNLAYGIGTEAVFSLHNGAKWAVCIEYIRIQQTIDNRREMIWTSRKIYTVDLQYIYVYTYIVNT